MSEAAALEKFSAPALPVPLSSGRNWERLGPIPHLCPYVTAAPRPRKEGQFGSARTRPRLWHPPWTPCYRWHCALCGIDALRRVALGDAVALAWLRPEWARPVHAGLQSYLVKFVKYAGYPAVLFPGLQWHKRVVHRLRRKQRSVDVGLTVWRKLDKHKHTKTASKTQLWRQPYSSAQTMTLRCSKCARSRNGGLQRPR